MKIYKECGCCASDVICDICGTSCRVSIGKNSNGDCIHNIVNAELKLDGCYGSSYDMTNLKCDMCEECFDKVKGFIRDLGGKIREEYSGW